MPRSRYWTLVLLGPRLTGNEIEMIGAGVDFGFAARADDVARAVWSLQRNGAAAVHALFLVRVGRINLPRSHLIRGCAPAFNLLMFWIGLAPSRHPNALERLVGALSPARPACISS